MNKSTYLKLAKLIRMAHLRGGKTSKNHVYWIAGFKSCPAFQHALNISQDLNRKVLAYESREEYIKNFIENIKKKFVEAFGEDFPEMKSHETCPSVWIGSKTKIIDWIGGRSDLITKLQREEQ